MKVINKITIIKYIIITLIVLTKCQATIKETNPVKNNTTNNTSARPLDVNSKNSTIKYFNTKSYSFKKKNFRFLKRHSIKDMAKLPKSVYYKVYISKTHKKIARVDEYRHDKLNRTVYYKYDNMRKPILAESYLPDGKLEYVSRYNKKHVLLSNLQYDQSGNVLFITRIKFLKKGLAEYWFNRGRELVLLIYYNKKFQPVRYAYYKSGKLNAVVDYLYDKKGFLRRQRHYSSRMKEKKYVDYQYASNGNIRHSKTYTRGTLSALTEYDKKGREKRMEQYHTKNKQKKGRVSFYTIYRYNDAGKDIKLYDERDNLLSWTKYNASDQLIQQYKYNHRGEETYVVKMTYENGLLKLATTQTFSKVKKDYYNKKGQVKKTENYFRGDLMASLSFFYDQKGRVKRTVHHSSDGKELLVWRHNYNKQNLVNMDFVYIKNKLIHAYLYTYFSGGRGYSVRHFIFKRLKEIKYYDAKKRLRKEEFFTSRLLPDKKTYADFKVRSIKYFYNKRNQILQKMYYDKTNRLEHIVVFTYKNGVKVQEHDFDRRKQYLGSVEIFYDAKGRLEKKVRYNKLKHKTETTYYDITGRLVKTEYHKEQ